MFIKLILIATVAGGLHGRPQHPQYYLLPAHDAANIRYQPVADHQNQVYSNLGQPQPILGPQYVPHNGLVYIQDQNEIQPQHGYIHSLYHKLGARPEAQQPPAADPTPEIPAEEPSSKESEGDASKEQISPKTQDDKSKLEDFEPDAELIPGGQIETRAEEPQPPQVPVTPFQGVLPGQSFFIVNPSTLGYPQFHTVYPQYHPGGYQQRFFIIGQPGQYNTQQQGQTVVLLGGLTDEQLRNSRAQNLQIPPAVLLDGQGYQQQDGQQSDDSQDDQRNEDSPDVENSEQQKSSEASSAPLEVTIPREGRTNDDVDSVVVEAKEEGKKKEKNDKKKPIVHSDLKYNPATAEAKPHGIALSGKGGTAQSNPSGTAIVGREGLAISNPIATALAGPLATKNFKIPQY